MLTNADFARYASFIAGLASRWAGDSLSTGSADDPMGDEPLARFILDMQKRLDHLWLQDVQWSPVPPTEGEPGSSFVHPRVSKIYPGFYAGRCWSCEAFMTAEKRTPRCDPCEIAMRAAVESRRSALTPEQEGRDGHG
ncbi:hypothetical protein [Methylobacterium sp. WL9]|uniref:hypothetical protein n=1 Tax=Methylobacterium sp. WL9 TaxID=2603898 RepID=UPI0011C7FC8E|nr:hypothetical protein [Methylobacterium sp. WL9]TXN24012.1 hypothetical protein FV217_04920 [Methylobacterium sp. WL9]